MQTLAKFLLLHQKCGGSWVNGEMQVLYMWYWYKIIESLSCGIFHGCGYSERLVKISLWEISSTNSHVDMCWRLWQVLHVCLSPHTSWNPVLKANTDPGQNKRHTWSSLQGYASVNVPPPPPTREGDLAGKVVSFDCKYVPDDGGLGRHFPFR
jgi:hypothetical protein